MRQPFRIYSVFFIPSHCYLAHSPPQIVWCPYCLSPPLSVNRGKQLPAGQSLDSVTAYFSNPQYKGLLHFYILNFESNHYSLNVNLIKNSNLAVTALGCRCSGCRLSFRLTSHSLRTRTPSSCQTVLPPPRRLWCRFGFGYLFCSVTRRVMDGFCTKGEEKTGDKSLRRDPEFFFLSSLSSSAWDHMNRRDILRQTESTGEAVEGSLRRS